MRRRCYKGEGEGEGEGEGDGIMTRMSAAVAAALSMGWGTGMGGEAWCSPLCSSLRLTSSFLLGIFITDLLKVP